MRLYLLLLALVASCTHSKTLGPGTLPGLSEPPRPPNDLGEQLRDRYLAEAPRSEQKQTRTRLRIKIGADGSVQTGAVIEGSDPVLERVCRRVLETNRWRAGVDLQGRRVAVETKFLCQTELCTNWDCDVQLPF